jgi:chromosome segregation ATPase
MSDRILELVDGIKEKVSLVKGQLEKECSKSESLQNEVVSLGDQLVEKQIELNDLSTKISELETKLITKKEQDVVIVKETGVSDSQIDELVKEIEYCIGQLKK